MAADLTAAAPAGEAAPAAEGEDEAEGETGEATTAEGEEDPSDKDSDDDDKKKDKKKGKKKGAVEITFDEDLGMFITRKKRKPGRAKDEVFGLLEDE